MRIGLSEDGLEIHVAGDGFAYEAFDKTGKMDLWAITRHFDLIASVAFANNFLGIMNSATLRTAFVRIQILEISSDFYTLASIFSPWRGTYRLSHLGNTSFWEEGTLRCEGSEKELVRRKMMGVKIDPTTRRPIPISEEAVVLFKETVKGKITTPPRVEFPTTIPDSAAVFTFTTKALPSDTDINQHINQAACLNYCMNCASVAAMRGGFLRMFNRDIAYYNVKKFSVEYVGEMRAGDVIHVMCWQDPNQYSVLYFHVKTGGKVACRCIGEWHTAPDGILAEFSQKVIPDSFEIMQSRTERGLVSNL